MDEMSKKNANTAINRWSASDVKVRQSHMKDIFIRHDRFMDAFNFIGRRHYPVIGGSPDYGKISTVIGESRAGKSAVAKKYLAEFPSSVGPSGIINPVLYVVIPTDTERALLSAICNALGLKPTLRMSNPVLWVNIQSALPQQKVELLLFDEVNTVIADGKRQSVAFSLNIFRKLGSGPIKFIEV